jgi:plasmid stabilization system protein ParE
MEVVWTAAAARGVWRAYQYLNERNPRAARELAEALYAAGDNLTDQPNRGRPVSGTRMRELVTAHPYIIRYRVSNDLCRCALTPRYRDLDEHPVKPRLSSRGPCGP